MAEHECEICSGPHDAAVHDATVRIHKWLRDDIAFKLKPITAPAPAPPAAENRDLPPKQKRQQRKKAA